MLVRFLPDRWFEKVLIQKSISPLSVFLPRFTIYKTKPTEVSPKDCPIMSVVIPNHGYDEYLENSINLIKGSSLVDIEIIVVNSTDTEHTEIYGKLKSDHKNETNVIFLETGKQKAGANRNMGIRRARSTNIVCIDPDDLMHPQFLEVIYFYSRLYNLDVCGAGMFVFGLEEKRWHTPLRPSTGMLSVRNAVPTNAFFRKEVWERVGGFKDIPGKFHIHEDWLFWHRISIFGFRIRNLDFPLTCIRIHESNTSRADNVPPDDIQARVIRDVNSDVKKTLELRLRATLNSFFNIKTRRKDLRIIAQDVRLRRKSESVFKVFSSNSQIIKYLQNEFQKVPPESIVVLCNRSSQSVVCGLPHTNLEIFNFCDLLPRKDWVAFESYLRKTRQK